MRTYRPALSLSIRHLVTAALAALSVTSVAAAPDAPASATPVTPEPLVAPIVNNVPASITVNEVPGWRQGYTLFVLPGQTITLATRVPDGSAYRWSGDGQFVLPGAARPKAATSGGAGTVLPAGSPVIWKAPKGVGGSLLVLRTATADGWSESARIDVQVMAPFEALADGLLAGYRIGRYPAQPQKKTVDQNLADYAHPVGFLKLPEKSDAPIKVSPRFFLHDFVCKQDGEGDRYVALRPELLQMLEAIVDRVESEGFRCSLVDHDGGTIQLASMGEGAGRSNIAPAAPGRPLLIMSGYRTPAYNRSLGNVKLSRHQFGDASDIIVDSDGDQVMDDLNHDGRVNGQDAITLASWVNEIWKTEPFAGRQGGLGVYNAEGEHGPFVHVDMRGVKARWTGNGLKWAEAEDDDAHDAPEPGAPTTAKATTRTKARKLVVR